MKFADITFEGRAYKARVLTDKEGFAYLVAGEELGRLLVDGDGVPYGEEAGSIDEAILFYAPEEWLALPDGELKKLLNKEIGYFDED